MQEMAAPDPGQVQETEQVQETVQLQETRQDDGSLPVLEECGHAQETVQAPELLSPRPVVVQESFMTAKAQESLISLKGQESFISARAQESVRSVNTENINGSGILSEAKKKVEALAVRSTIFDTEAEKQFPRFEMDEVGLGRVLGRGGFCVVNEIRNVDLSCPFHGDEAQYEDEPHDREHVRAHVIRNGDARYALKQLSKEIRRDADRYLKGIIDLAIEVKFLSVLENPHIIKMRAVSNRNPFSETGYFVVLDRLYDTLEKRVFVWRKRKSGMTAILARFGKVKRKTDLLVERLVVAYDLCSALLYLHRLKVIYRDLKPENIGFDVRDDVKIFDFGLAKELHEEDALEDGTYKLTGITGSLRYMAPEVATWKPYTFSADVYSFGILLWQILSVRQPFEGYNIKMHNELVVHKGYRPKVKDSWPLSWAVLLRNCWSSDLTERPDLEDVIDTLRTSICEIRGDDDDLELDQTRRSLRSN